MDTLQWRVLFASLGYLVLHFGSIQFLTTGRALNGTNSGRYYKTAWNSCLLFSIYYYYYLWPHLRDKYVQKMAVSHNDPYWAMGHILSSMVIGEKSSFVWSYESGCCCLLAHCSSFTAAVRVYVRESLSTG